MHRFQYVRGPESNPLKTKPNITIDASEDLAHFPCLWAWIFHATNGVYSILSTVFFDKHILCFSAEWLNTVNQERSQTGMHCPVVTGKYHGKHWDRDKMATILPTTLFLTKCSWMKMSEFWFQFHSSLFELVQMTLSRHWIRQWLVNEQATSHYLNQKIFVATWHKQILPLMADPFLIAFSRNIILPDSLLTYCWLNRVLWNLFQNTF